MTTFNLSNNSEFDKIIDWLAKDLVEEPYDRQFQLETRDIFQAKLDALFPVVNDSLLIAVLGEIGNNSFDHNLGKWEDIQGVYFRPSDLSSKIIVLADRGQGVKKTISRVVPEVADDLAALKIAFTQVISGRSPEQRGNGLKFVSSVVRENDWELFFQSGVGCVTINNNGLNFFGSDRNVKGCLAVLKTKGVK